MEEQNEQGYENMVQVDLKKSSSKDGKVGFNIIVKCNDKATQEIMDKIAQISLTTALKVQAKLPL